jgi:ornithine decarboxylase
VKVISEPGQFFATHSMTLVVNVHSKSVKQNENGEEIYHYYITDGIYQSFSMKGSGGHNPNPLNIKTLRNTEGMNLKKSVVWGRTCDPNDQVEDEILLPELECGDWLVLEDFGAYRVTTSSGFNGFPQHPVFNYIEREMW